MTSILDTTEEQPAETRDLLELAESELGTEHTESVDDLAVPPVMLRLATISAILSAWGAAWMIGGVFRGQQGRAVGMLGVLVGAAVVFLAARFRSSVLQYAVLPVTLLVGAALVAPAAGAGTSSLPALVKDAAQSAQVLQPPIDFAPGWRMILVVVLGLIAAAALSLSLSLSRPRLSVVVPLPLTVGAALVQPAGTAVVTSAVAIGFVMMSLATSYASDSSGQSFDRGFELRRLTRSAATGLGLVGALLLASQLSFLFPEPNQDRTVPPQRPPAGKPQPDVPLFRVTGDIQTPLRLGVIDVYDATEQAWLLPPVETKRLERLTLPADVPAVQPRSSTRKTVTAEIEVQQAQGRLLPTLPYAVRIAGDVTVDADPRTQTLQLVGRPVYTGLRYSVTAGVPPTGAELSEATDPVPESIRPFLQAPPAPPAVSDLLAKAPEGSFARLQHVRTALYKKFIAAGQGRPTDVSPDRVAELLGGGTGNPYELTAAEALLARWAGIPARLGYGYFGGTTQDDGSRVLRPNNAATYLEAYFAPYGWVPVLGTPPQAQASLSNNQRNSDPNIQASDELGIVVFLPTRSADGIPLYVYARYYLVRALPAVLVALTLVAVYPVLLKRVRRRRRARWAAGLGPAGGLALAYVEMRDAMIDLGLPGRQATPLETYELVEPDEEHAELAWLVTRGLWGDLRETLGEEDAEQARFLSRSVRSRLVQAQPPTARLLAAVSRASLRDPYSAELPNVWWTLRLRQRVRALLSRGRRRLTVRLGVVRRLRPSSTTASLVVVLATLLVGCGGPSAPVAQAVPFPTRLAPSSIGGLVVKTEAKADQAYLSGARDDNVLVSRGKVLSFSRDGLIQAALQVAQLKPGYSSTDSAVTTAIAQSIGKVSKLPPAGEHELYRFEDSSQRIFLWFPTGGQSMALLVVRAQVPSGAAELLARSLIAYGDGSPVDERSLAAALNGTTNPADPAAPSTQGAP